MSPPRIVEPFDVIEHICLRLAPTSIHAPMRPFGYHCRMDQPAENVDIDTETDWRLAEAFLSLGQSPNLDLVPRP